MLNEDKSIDRVNHKRVYRVMRQHGLLLALHTGRPTLRHDGKVQTLKSDLRWCTDAFEIRCFNGEKVYVVFSLDCCDREAMAFRASTSHPTGETIRDLMACTRRSERLPVAGLKGCHPQPEPGAPIGDAQHGQSGSHQTLGAGLWALAAVGLAGLQRVAEDG